MFDPQKSGQHLAIGVTPTIELAISLLLDLENHGCPIDHPIVVTNRDHSNSHDLNSKLSISRLSIFKDLVFWGMFAPASSTGIEKFHDKRISTSKRLTDYLIEHYSELFQSLIGDHIEKGKTLVLLPSVEEEWKALIYAKLVLKHSVGVFHTIDLGSSRVPTRLW